MHIDVKIFFAFKLNFYSNFTHKLSSLGSEFSVPSTQIHTARSIYVAVHKLHMQNISKKESKETRKSPTCGLSEIAFLGAPLRGLRQPRQRPASTKGWESYCLVSQQLPRAATQQEKG